MSAPMFYLIAIIAGVGFMCLVTLFLLALCWVCARDEDRELEEIHRAGFEWRELANGIDIVECRERIAKAAGN